MAVRSIDSQQEGLIERRWELFARAAPLFRTHGFDGVTLRALAHACHLSPAALYHYFDSKLTFALFPLTHQSGMCGAWRIRQLPLADDPETRLTAFIDLLIDYGEHLRLAARLAREIEIRHDRRLDGRLARTVRQARSDVAGLLIDMAPHVTIAQAEAASEGLLQILTGELPGVAWNPQDVRAQMLHLVDGLLATQTHVAIGRSA